ncbi:MAG: ABC transporter substrate-binding protein [Burkholderiaceae bacterium]
MRELGWVEGVNVSYQYVYANGDMSQLDRFARDLVSQRPEVILVPAPPAVRAVSGVTKTIPMVMANVSNAVGNGFISSLAKPGGNITGITSQFEDVLGKLISILHEVSPDARRISVLLNETNPSHRVFWEVAQSACLTLGLEPIRNVANTPAQLAIVADKINQQQSQAVVVVADGMFWSLRSQLNDSLLTTGLPVAYQMHAHAYAGGLLSYASNLKKNFHHAAKFVDKILKGANPATLPVEQPTDFELIVNMKTAKKLGINIPAAVLLQADVVVQ